MPECKAPCVESYCSLVHSLVVSLWWFRAGLDAARLASRVVVLCTGPPLWRSGAPMRRYWTVRWGRYHSKSTAYKEERVSCPYTLHKREGRKALAAATKLHRRCVSGTLVLPCEWSELSKGRATQDEAFGKFVRSAGSSV